MTNLPAIQDFAAVMEQVVISNDLGSLDASQRMAYYQQLCDSLELNPIARPFEYIQLPARGEQPAKLTLYATKACTDQLRAKHRISIPGDRIRERIDGTVLKVWATAVMPDGREDTDLGAVSITYGRSGDFLTGEALANAHMKALTKAKRRVTLSICGLGMLDEIETDSVPGAVLVQSRPQGENFDPKVTLSNTPETHSKAILAKQGENLDRETSTPESTPETANSPDPEWTVESLRQRTWDYMERVSEAKPKISQAIDPKETERARKRLEQVYSPREILPVAIEAAARYLAHADRGDWSTFVHAQSAAIRQGADELIRWPTLADDFMRAAVAYSVQHPVVEVEADDSDTPF